MRGRDQILLEDATERVVNPKLKVLKKFANPLPTDQDKFNFIKKMAEEHFFLLYSISEAKTEDEFLNDHRYPSLKDYFAEEYFEMDDKLTAELIKYCHWYWSGIPSGSVKILPIEDGTIRPISPGFKNMIIRETGESRRDRESYIVLTKF